MQDIVNKQGKSCFRYDDQAVMLSKSYKTNSRLIFNAGVLVSNYKITNEEKRYKIIAACLLSRISNRSLIKEVDFHKERVIIRNLGDESYENDIITMLSYISYHHNRDTDFSNVEKWKLVPRMASLQFIISASEIIKMYSTYVNNKLTIHQMDDATPLCFFDVDVMNHATPERYDAYVKRGFKSESMIDYIYDKLLQIFKEDIGVSPDDTDVIETRLYYEGLKYSLINIALISSHCRYDKEGFLFNSKIIIDNLIGLQELYCGNVAT